ncbi:MAG: hypothetical protein KDA83_21005, partial [Planctomycetales bacterium]|nr:hypothetical protein [Planctomycetales bacterium]
MSTMAARRTRGIAPAPRSPWERAWKAVSSRESRIRASVALLAVVAMWLGTNGWAPPFPFRLGQTPDRDVVARVDFDVLDEQATRNALYEARRQSLCVYINEPQPLEEIQQQLIDEVLQIKSADSLNGLPEGLWKSFLPVPVDGEPTVDPSTQRADFELFRSALTTDGNLAKVKRAVEISLLEFEKNGLLRTLAHTADEGPLTEIRVVRNDSARASRRVNASD